MGSHGSAQGHFPWAARKARKCPWGLRLFHVGCPNAAHGQPMGSTWNNQQNHGQCKRPCTAGPNKRVVYYLSPAPYTYFLRGVDVDPLYCSTGSYSRALVACFRLSQRRTLAYCSHHAKCSHYILNRTVRIPPPSAILYIALFPIICSPRALTKRYDKNTHYSGRSFVAAFERCSRRNAVVMCDRKETISSGTIVG